MKIGIHAFAWCKTWTNAQLFLIDKVASMSGQFIEIPMMEIDFVDAPAIRKKCSDAGIEAVTSTVLSAERDIASQDVATREKGISFLKYCIEKTADMGAKSFSGVIYGEFAPTKPRKPNEEQWNIVAEALAAVNARAKELGVMLGIEPVNRYETPFINTCEQGLYLKKLIGDDNVKIHLDTYHMNIEEKDYYTAVMQAKDALVHFHLCENDRGIPGTGLVNWDAIFKGLRDISYDGYAGLESFVDLTDSMNTWVWRQLASSGDVLLQEGMSFICSMQEKYNLL